MRKFFFCLGLLALSFAAHAQNMYDALNYVQSERIGTARSLGMGNAMVAIGGDLASVALNPAGSSATSYSQIAFTIGSNISLSTAQGTTLPGSSTPYCFDNRFRKSDAAVAVPNFGINFNFDTGRNFGVKAFSFAIIANTNNYSKDNLFTSGRHSGTSIAGALGVRASGVPYTSYDGDKAYDCDWPSAVAWRSGMISTAGTSTSDYVGATEKFIEDEDGNRQFFTAGALNQEYGRRISGSNSDYIFNLSMNVSDAFFLGASLGVNSIAYKFDEYIKESPVNPDDFDIDFGSSGTTYFKSLKYQNWYTASGSGAYFQLGFLAVPGNFRIGASFKTPSVATIRERWGYSAETHFLSSGFDGKASSPQGDFSYKLATPWEFNGGLAVTMARMAVLSVDYELDLNSSMKFKPYYEDDNYNELDLFLMKNAGQYHKVRAGLEVRPLDWLSVRAGYNFSARCLGCGRQATIARDVTFSHAASAGLGFSTEGPFYFDLACKALFRPKEFIYPYDDYDKSSDGTILHFSPEILNLRQLFTAVFTIGYRF